MSEFDWTTVVEDGVCLRRENGVAIVEGDPPESEGVKFFTSQPRRALLNRLSEDPFHQANWELDSYCPILGRFLDCGSAGPETLVADLGSGDGRYTLWLLRNFPVRVVAVDVVPEALSELAAAAANEGFHDRLLLVRSSIESLPMRTESVGSAIAINSLYYLGDRIEKGVAEFSRILRKGGIAISTRHVPEAVFLRTLFFNGVKSFVDAVKSSSVTESDAEGAPRFPVLSQKENRELFNRHGLTEVEEAGIPLFEQLVSLCGRTDSNMRAEIETHEPELRAILNSLRSESSWFRTLVLKQMKATI